MKPQEINIENKADNYGTIVADNRNGEIHNHYYNGMSVQEAEQLAISLFQANFPKLQQDAEELVKKRVEEIAKEFFSQIALQCPDKFEHFSDPDIQYNLIEVQKSYARNGNEYLKNTLASLLIHRVQSNNDFLSICLNEAIKLVPSLTPALLDLLSLRFIVSYTINNNIVDISSLNEYISSNILPFIKREKPTEKDKAHLTSFRCGQDSIETASAFGIALVTHYSQIFKNINSGFSLEWPSLGTPEEYPEWKIDDNGNILNIKQFIINKIPMTSEIFEYYDGWLCGFTLTSLGKLIGAINAENKLKIKLDLSIWI
jgi:hypothetical protein